MTQLITVQKFWKEIALVALLLVTLTSMFTADHWWKRIGEAKVIYNGQPSPKAAVYRSSDGRWLVNLKDHADGLYEVHYFDQGAKWMVGYTSDTTLLSLLGYAFIRETNPTKVDMGGVKIEVDPHLIVRQNSLEFTSTKSARVQVFW